MLIWIKQHLCNIHGPQCGLSLISKQAPSAPPLLPSRPACWRQRRRREWKRWHRWWSCGYRWADDKWKTPFMFRRQRPSSDVAKTTSCQRRWVLSLMTLPRQLYDVTCDHWTRTTIASEFLYARWYHLLW